MSLSTRKLLVGLSAAGAVTAAFGTTIHQASADARQLSVTLAGGRVVQITVDVPPGTPVNQIPLPDLGAPVLRVTDASAPSASTSTAPSAASTTTAPTPPAATDDGADARKQARRIARQAEREQARSRRHRTDGRKVTRRDKHGHPAKHGASASHAKARTDKGGAPTPADPSFAEAIPGPSPMGVPNFTIDKFRIPPFLLPIYQAAGIQYGIRWEVLAGINEIETDYGRNLSVSTAGARGWMQFMPETWKRYGVDANGDGKKDSYNPVDAIFAAARYLKAAGGDKDIKKAIFAYNHAGWYVDSVLLRARLINGLPPDLIGSLTGLTEGIFPVAAKTRYAGDEDVKKARARVKGANAARPVASKAKRHSIALYADSGSPAVAVQDGKVVRMGHNERLGRFVQLRDVYGNTYTYGNLKSLAAFYPVPKNEKKASSAQADPKPKADPKPTGPASAGTQRPGTTPKASRHDGAPTPSPDVRSGPVATDSDAAGKERLFANPGRPAARAHGGEEQIANAGLDSGSHSSYLSTIPGLRRQDVRLKPLKKGARVLSGTMLGRLGRTDENSSPHLNFEIRPAGAGAPRVDPKPILDGWKLLESTAIYRANGRNPLFGDDGSGASAGQVLLMSKAQLQQRVLADHDLDVYAAGRKDVETGAIDRRVLATLEYLTANGLRLSVSSMKSGHGILTTSGNVSEHSSGNAVDISEVNGIPILGHQGAGSITDSTIRLLLKLQGTMKPHQIISLMTFPGTDNTLSLPDHANHIHVGFRPQFANDPKLAKRAGQVLKPGQWIKLIDRIGQIDNPTVVQGPSKYTIRAPKSGD